MAAPPFFRHQQVTVGFAIAAKTSPSPHDVARQLPRISAMTAVAHDFTHLFFLVYAGLFPIINPVGNAPIFLALTRYCTDRERRALALRVAVNGFFLLLGSLLIGSYVLEFFGITLPVLRIAGGVVVTAFGWTLLQHGEELGNQRTAEAAGRPDTASDAFYPLTMPLTVGPGAISVAVALGSQRPIEVDNLARLAVVAGAAIAGLAAVAATIYICYRFAEPTIAALGKYGTNVVVRLSAFLLLCIGIQIIWTGISGLQAPWAFSH